jgi:hypothetical protein
MPVVVGLVKTKLMRRLVTITSVRLNVAWYPSNIKFDGVLEEGIFKEPDDVEPVSCGSVMPVTDRYNTSVFM